MASLHTMFLFVYFMDEEQIVGRTDGPPQLAQALTSIAGIMFAASKMSARGPSAYSLPSININPLEWTIVNIHKDHYTP